MEERLFQEFDNHGQWPMANVTKNLNIGKRKNKIISIFEENEEDNFNLTLIIIYNLIIMEERSFEFWLPDNRCRDDNFSISEAEVVIDKFSQSQMIKHNILNVVEKISL